MEARPYVGCRGTELVIFAVGAGLRARPNSLKVMLPRQRVFEKYILDVLLMIVEETRHDRGENRRGR